MFKSRRQRGERVGYAPTEFQLHCTGADALRRWIDPAWLWSHLPFGEHRAPATAGRLARPMRIDATLYTALGHKRITLEQALAMMTPI